MKWNLQTKSTLMMMPLLLAGQIIMERGSDPKGLICNLNSRFEILENDSCLCCIELGIFVLAEKRNSSFSHEAD